MSYGEMNTTLRHLCKQLTLRPVFLCNRLDLVDDDDVADDLEKKCFARLFAAEIHDRSANADNVFCAPSDCMM